MKKIHTNNVQYYSFTSQCPLCNSTEIDKWQTDKEIERFGKLPVGTPFTENDTLYLCDHCGWLFVIKRREG